ncbi:Predicted metalloprotease, contains C-terminal PDZ domain [Flexibacter flexilis DSM 6793]|uniref:Predicted metalloprotease, contains C-terminal PDZ domain n=1 Tax=Flexibacter flexilis DSM 6793 TaxID=927664 RepID=A0A1I1K0V5_9BACT|nr:PDZ domain-containing protein [Flexibacter flexilis]SFC54245.1 Predicted metalloprotease, contains C-terminal PDZ domain [Flexibacter flexilis DSM 6793]
MFKTLYQTALLMLIPLAASVLAKAETSAQAPKLEYVLSVTEPHAHYFDVEINVSGLKQDYVDLKMAVWTPGSYLVREYARQVEGFKAENAGKSLGFDKINKNTWRVQTQNADKFSVKYRVYAYELTVRTSYVDATQGYLNGASVFMFLDKKQDLPSTLTVKPYATWKEITTALKPIGKDKWVLNVPNFDTLADSPIQLGNQTIFNFTASGIDHKVAMCGEGNYDIARLQADMKAVTEAAKDVVGEHPCTDYTFIVHNTPTGGGGLEHLNSTTLVTSKFGYQNPSSYEGFLSLVAHEYFHLWNVKRIRPKALGPFDYENENYTHLLWVSEGFTAYYDDYLVRRAGITTPEAFLNVVGSNFSYIENTPGSRYQSATESSFDAWIKYYRPTENSNNASISYYNKGGVVATILDLEILQSTGGTKSLDDVMRYLYQEYYKKQQRGFTDEEMQKAVELVAGKSMDEFFKKYIWGTDAINYGSYLAYAGLQLTDRFATRQEAYLGANASNQGGKLVVTSVVRNSPAYKSGIYVNDEIIAIDKYRVGSDLASNLANRKIGEKVKVLVSRGGVLETVELTLERNPVVSYQISRVSNPTAQQETIYKKWLRIK